MKINCCYFEDHLLENFHPLTLTRPVYDLRVGIFTLAEKWEHAIQNQSPVSGPLRGHLRGVFPEFIIPKNKADTLWINPRFFPVNELVPRTESLETGSGLIYGKQLIAARIDAKTHMSWYENGFKIPDIRTEAVKGDWLLSVKMGIISIKCKLSAI